MNIQDPAIFYILILLISSFALLSLILVILYVRLVSKLAGLKEEQKLDPRFRLLDEAEVSAKKMIQKALVRSSEIINSADLFNKENLTYFQKKIDLVSQNYGSKYNEILQKIEEEIYKELSSVSTNINKEVKIEIDTFRAAIQKELLIFQKSMSQAVKDSYQKAEVEIENYRDIRMKQVDESILEVVEEVSRKVLTKEISETEHEKLVLRALEEVKRENLLLKESQKKGDMP